MTFSRVQTVTDQNKPKAHRETVKPNKYISRNRRHEIDLTVVRCISTLAVFEAELHRSNIAPPLFARMRWAVSHIHAHVLSLRAAVSDKHGSDRLSAALNLCILTKNFLHWGLSALYVTRINTDNPEVLRCWERRAYRLYDCVTGS